jgi:hypothetical protein
MRGVSSIRVFHRALGGASHKTWILKGTPRFFFAPGGVVQGKGAETKKDVRFAGLVASNGRRREK